MKRYLVFILIAVLLGGCGFKEYNAAVQQNNKDMFCAFGDAMAKQTSEGGRTAVALLFGLGLGQQKLQVPETVKDYLLAASRAVSPFVPLMYRRHDESSQSMSAGRDIYYGSTRQDSISQDRSNYVEGESEYTVSPSWEATIEVDGYTGDTY